MTATPGGEAPGGAQARERPIGVFDSGIGGLTVVREIVRQLPEERIVYFGDSARVPYGGKSPETVRRFAIEDAHFLLRRDVKFLVVACNTASAVALDALERRFDLPLIGVIEPGAREAVRRTRTKRIGVIGTHATIRSRAYERAIRAIDPACAVEGIACPLFVPLAEEGWTAGEVAEAIAVRYLDPLARGDVDTVILGCTHYPILRETIAKVLGPEIALIDTAEATAAELGERLRSLGLAREGGGRGERRFFMSDVPLRFREIGSAFLGEPIEDVTWIEQTDIPWYER